MAASTFSLRDRARLHLINVALQTGDYVADGIAINIGGGNYVGRCRRADGSRFALEGPGYTLFGIERALSTRSKILLNTILPR